MTQLTPQVSAWYQDLSTGSLFEVVAIDEQSNSIEYQLLDGEIGEIEQASWSSLPLSKVEAPEDWRTPFEISDESGLDDLPHIPENFSGVLAELEAERIDLGDDFQLFDPPT
jgi:hypothetical protein